MNSEAKFSIDPYIESGGVFGNRIEVSDSANHLISAIELHKGVEVNVFDFRTATDADVEKVDLDTRSVLSKGEDWTVKVFDERIWRDADEWMKRNYSRGDQQGNNLLEERFLTNLNGEINNGVLKAFDEERLDSTHYNFNSFGINLLVGGFSASAIYVGGGQVVENIPYIFYPDGTGVEPVFRVSGGLILSVAGVAFGSLVAEGLMEERRAKNLRNVLLPNPGIIRAHRAKRNIRESEPFVAFKNKTAEHADNSRSIFLGEKALV